MMETHDWYNMDLEDATVLRSAFNQGIVQPVIGAVDWKVFDWALRNYRELAYNNKDLYPEPQTQRYMEDVQSWVGVDQANSSVVELARLAVPVGSVGFLKSIEQFINDSDSDFYPTSSELWGLPFQNEPELEACTWFLRLQPYTGIMPARINQTIAAPITDFEPYLPGRPFEDLPHFTDIWYPPHCASKMPNIVIPGGFVLRFFFTSPPAVKFRWRVAGRLRGIYQSATCAEARHNARISAW